MGGGRRQDRTGGSRGARHGCPLGMLPDLCNAITCSAVSGRGVGKHVGQGKSRGLHIGSFQLRLSCACARRSLQAQRRQGSPMATLRCRTHCLRDHSCALACRALGTPWQPRSLRLAGARKPWGCVCSRSSTPWRPRGACWRAGACCTRPGGSRAGLPPLPPHRHAAPPLQVVGVPPLHPAQRPGLLYLRRLRLPASPPAAAARWRHHSGGAARADGDAVRRGPGTCSRTWLAHPCPRGLARRTHAAARCCAAAACLTAPLVCPTQNLQGCGGGYGGARAEPRLVPPAWLAAPGCHRPGCGCCPTGQRAAGPPARRRPAQRPSSAAWHRAPPPSRPRGAAAAAAGGGHGGGGAGGRSWGH